MILESHANNTRTARCGGNRRDRYRHFRPDFSAWPMVLETRFHSRGHGVRGRSRQHLAISVHRGRERRWRVRYRLPTGHRDRRSADHDVRDPHRTARPAKSRIHDEAARRGGIGRGKLEVRWRLGHFLGVRHPFVLQRDRGLGRGLRDRIRGQCVRRRNRRVRGAGVQCARVEPRANRALAYPVPCGDGVRHCARRRARHRARRTGNDAGTHRVAAGAAWLQRGGRRVCPGNRGSRN